MLVDSLEYIPYAVAMEKATMLEYQARPERKMSCIERVVECFIECCFTL